MYFECLCSLNFKRILLCLFLSAICVGLLSFHLRIHQFSSLPKQRLRLGKADEEYASYHTNKPNLERIKDPLITTDRGSRLPEDSTTLSLTHQSEIIIGPPLAVSEEGDFLRPFSSYAKTADAYYKMEKLWGCYDYKDNRLAASRSPASDGVLKRLGCKKRAPDVILLGVKKCGTQTLTGFMDLHPDVVSSVYPFSTETVTALKDNDSSSIVHKMPLSSSSEVTFVDMIDIQNYPEVLGNLIKMSKKSLMILVNPVLRAQSDYAHVRTKMKTPENINNVKRRKMPVWDTRLRGRIELNIFYKGYRIADSFAKSVLNSSGNIDETNELIRKGFYTDYIKEILKQTSRENLLVLDGEIFSKEPWTILKTVERFLGISDYFTKEMFRKRGKFYCPVLKERPDAACLKGKGRSKRRVDPNVKHKLQHYFQPLNRQLKDILEQTFSWK